MEKQIQTGVFAGNCRNMQSFPGKYRQGLRDNFNADIIIEITELVLKNSFVIFVMIESIFLTL